MNKETNTAKILASKSVEKNGFPFPSPAKLLQPVLNEFKKLEGFEIETVADEPLTLIDAENNELIGYKRVLAKATIELTEGIKYQIGFVYALDLKTPLIKIFTGAEVIACTNMAVFGATDFVKLELLTNLNKAPLIVEEFCKNSSAKLAEIKEMIFKMQNYVLTKRETYLLLGKMLAEFQSNEFKSVAGTTSITNAAKLLFNSKSPYYWENSPNVWNFYNACTDNLREKTHVIDQPEKVFNFFKVIHNWLNKFENTKPLPQIAEATPKILGNKKTGNKNKTNKK